MLNFKIVFFILIIKKKKNKIWFNIKQNLYLGEIFFFFYFGDIKNKVMRISYF